jgi:hydroxymethylpyrimidine/phosphomethylpyrimidine kinase
LKIAATIAGSDSGGGAGIQSDIKTFSALGIFSCSVVTAITSQNTFELRNIFPVPSKIVSEQLRAILSDFKVAAIKIGMLYNAEIMETVSKKLKNVKPPIVIDPILSTGTGFSLILKNDLEYFKEAIVPISYLLTPNLPEAEALSGIKIRTSKTLVDAANAILDMGANNVIIKGGHSNKTKGITDLLLTQDRKIINLRKERLEINPVHGLGCNFSAAVTAALATQVPLVHACHLANEYILFGINNSVHVGKGSAVFDPCLFFYSNSDKFLVLEELDTAISSIESTENFGTLIPETSSNLAYAIARPTGPSDVAAVEGRIARVGSKARAVGRIRFGASRHVGSAIMSYMKIHPHIRSAINLRYDEKILEICKEKFQVSSYDRHVEPRERKAAEGMSIPWGIEIALRMNPSADVIYHLGGIGKEAMILVFDKNPSLLVRKVRNILNDFISEST